MKYLFLGAHTDDIELCCGGTIGQIHSHENTIIIHAFTALGRADIEAEYIESLKHLEPQEYGLSNYPVRLFHEHRQDIAQDIIRLAEGCDFVFTHSKFDGHPDHATIGFECERVLKNCNLITYCAPWNSLGFDFNYFVRLSEMSVKDKIKACAMYASQQHRPYLNPDYLYSEMRVAGIQCGSVFAERFRAVRLIS